LPLPEHSVQCATNFVLTPRHGLCTGLA